MRSFYFAILTVLLCSCSNTGKDENDQSWTLTGFEKADSINPILNPSPDQKFTCPVSGKEVRWEERNVLNPSAVVRNGKIYLIYRSQDSEMTSRLGLAVSDDGLHFVKRPEPVFYPDSDKMNIYEWKGGVEDPRIVVSPEGRYIMTYTAYDGHTARLCLATSDDLEKWEKHGPVLGDDEYRDYWSKSGAIVSELRDGQITAARINGKYWMYFGDTDLFMAVSLDLITWKPLLTEDRKLMQVLHPRPGYFDSRLVEPGPYALLQDKGVLLIYNGSNSYMYNDTTLPVHAYAAGQALFDRYKPYRLIDRTPSYFIHPDKEYEKRGEVNEVCFVEGLVRFKDHWFLYYGTADSKIAVAVASQRGRGTEGER